MSRHRRTGLSFIDSELKGGSMILATLALLTLTQDARPTDSALIDRQISKTWADAVVPHAGPCDDAEFLRRVSLDIVGLLPSHEETRAVLKDPRPGKRAAKRDQLLTTRASTPA